MNFWLLKYFNPHQHSQQQAKYCFKVVNLKYVDIW